MKVVTFAKSIYLSLDAGSSLMSQRLSLATWMQFPSGKHPRSAEMYALEDNNNAQTEPNVASRSQGILSVSWRGKEREDGENWLDSSPSNMQVQFT